MITSLLNTQPAHAAPLANGRRAPLPTLLTAHALRGLRGLHFSCSNALRRQRALLQARRTAQALAHLDDRMLRDIGVDRSELSAIGAELHGISTPSRRHSF